MGSALSGEVSDTRELASVFLEAFGREYEKLYMWYMIRHVRQVLERETEPSGDGLEPTWKLYHAPYLPTQLNPRDTVIAAKLSKHLKKWKPRFFVLRGDYLVDYYENRSDFLEKKKPLGTITLGNMSVGFNATQEEEARADQLAAMCGVPRSDIPEPRKFADMTIEFHHPRKGTIRLQIPIKDRYDFWCRVFERAHWLGARLENNDRVHQRAFVEAFTRARRSCGLPHSMEFGGGEPAILHDTITELVDTRVAPKLVKRKSDITWKERMTLLKEFKKESEEFLNGFVLGKWHAIQGHTIGRCAAIEAQVRDYMDAITTFELPLREEIHKYIHKDTRAFLLAHVELPLKELSAAVTPRLRAVYATLPKLFTACVSQGKVLYEMRQDRMFLATQYNSIGECYDAERELLELREPIAAMKEKFNGCVYEWIVLERSALRFLRRLVVNGVYTFETVFERNKAQHSWDDAQREVLALVEADRRTVVRHALTALLYETAVHYFQNEYVVPALEALKTPMITPLEDRVPDDLRPFIVSAQEIVVDVLHSDLHDMCNTIAGMSPCG